MEHLGNNTKSIFLVGPESHKLHQEFESIGDIGVITLSADLVADDVVSGKINGQEFTVTYGTSHAATMTALATAITALTGVAKAWVHGATSRVISFLLATDTAAVVFADVAVTNGGAGTAAASTSVVDGKVIPGEPVILIGLEEKVAPSNLFEHFALANAAANMLGVCIHDHSKGDLVTIACKGYVITYGQASGALAVGPVTADGHDLTTGYVKYKTGVASNICGLALDAGADTDVVRILMFQ